MAGGNSLFGVHGFCDQSVRTLDVHDGIMRCRFEELLLLDKLP